jgi:hypothetical protein
MSISLNRLFAHLPSVYDDRDRDGENTTLLEPVANQLDELREVQERFRKGRFVEDENGTHLDVVGENYGVGRPPGMNNQFYASLIRAMNSCRRTTLEAIKSIVEAASGMTGVVVDDMVTDPSLPAFHIRVRLPATQSGSEGRGFYLGLPADTDGFPVPSATMGPVMEEAGEAGGLFNDHFWSVLDVWTEELIDRVRLHGTKLWFEYAPIPITPMAYWRLKEEAGTTAEDSAEGGSGYNGTLLGGASWVTAPSPAPLLLSGQKVLELDGTGYVSTPAFEVGGAMSFALWMRPTNLTGDRFAIGFQTLSADTLFLFTSGTSLTFQTDVSGSTVTATAVMALDTWHHVVATVSSSGLLSLYLNGSLVATASGSAPSLATRTVHELGRSFQYPAGYVGQISECSIFGRELSQEQVQQLYNGHKGKNANLAVLSFS